MHPALCLISTLDTTRRQSGEIATLCHYDGDRSSQKYSGRRTPHGPGIRVPFQRRHAFAGLDVPHLERAVVRTRHDAPPVQRYGNAKDLQRRHVITKVQRTPQRTSSECPFSVATHFHPVSNWKRIFSPGRAFFGHVTSTRLPLAVKANVWPGLTPYRKQIFMIKNRIGRVPVVHVPQTFAFVQLRSPTP